MTDTYDCIVIGGGPAGSTVGALVAEQGHRTLIIERAQFPRFHIGESLIPETYWTLKRLGMLDKMKSSDFVKKYSVQFTSASGRDSQPFYFDEMNPHECSQTWQVLRSRFDDMLLQNAAEKGATVWQNASVTSVLMNQSPGDSLPRAIGVTVVRQNESEQRLTAKVVVDATGTSALISKKLNIRKPDPMLRKAALFAHYKGCRRDEGKNAGATLVLATKNHDGWFWYIPLPDDILSIGVVGDIDHLITGRSNPNDTLDEEIKNCAGLNDRMENATRVSEVRVLSDFSWRASRCSGDGWVLVGDAFGFLDPMYSSGVFLALKSGEMAADAINQAFQLNDFSAAQLGQWGNPLSEGMQAIRKLVYCYYDKGFSFGRFLKAHPHFKRNITELLVGDVFRPQVNEVFNTLGQTVDLPLAVPLEDPAGMPKS
jgi:flavin-dependent dehydrogenase